MRLGIDLPQEYYLALCEMSADDNTTPKREAEELIKIQLRPKMANAKFIQNWRSVFECQKEQKE